MELGYYALSGIRVAAEIRFLHNLAVVKSQGEYKYNYLSTKPEPAAVKKETGFTLVEILIASLIFVVLMVSVYAAFRSGIFGYRSIDENIDTYQAARIILERLNRDLHNSFAYSNEDTKFIGSETEISFLTLTDSGADFTFVSYKLDGDKLMRLFRKNQEALKEGSEIRPRVVASNLSIKFAYGYPGERPGEIQFNDSTNETLPLAVRVSLTINKETARSFERTIYLTLA